MGKATSCLHPPRKVYGTPVLRKKDQEMRQKTLMFVFVGVTLCWFPASGVMATDNPCQEAQEILGLSLTPLTKSGSGTTTGLVVTEIAPLSQAARIGLLKGDVIEQVNSWRARDCQSYSRAVQDAQGEQKAVLLLITRKGRRQTLAFEPEMWVRKEKEQQEKASVASLQTMLAAPLPPTLKGKVGNTGEQALAILHELETVAVSPGKPSAYEQGVAKAKKQLVALDQASQGEGEKRVVAGAQVLLGYYVTAQDIRQYKQEFVQNERKDLRKGRAATFTSSSVPYFLKSPVPGWIDRYPFLRASVSESPQTVNFLEQPGRWDPDRAVELLWQKAKEETESFARWLKGEGSSQRSAVSGQH
jgi:hypothetical protein